MPPTTSLLLSPNDVKSKQHIQGESNRCLWSLKTFGWPAIDVIFGESVITLLFYLLLAQPLSPNIRRTYYVRTISRPSAPRCRLARRERQI